MRALVARACAATRALVWAALLLGATSVLGQPSVQTVISNGPSANRFNIAVLSEGYTAGQLALFGGHASNIVSALLEHHPFNEYRGFFNAFAIAVPSAQTGSDHPASGISVSTYFSSSYDLYDRMVTIPAGSQGQGRVDTLLQSLLPECDLAIVLVNDMIPAGSDGSGQTAVVSRGTSLTAMSDILAHEVGHVMAGLGDEYEAAFPGYPDTEEPNTTRETRREFIKWKSWIAPETPVPTPPWFEYRDVVGLFEGAHYHSAGWYRPRLNCAMRDNVSPFCEVCAQALILALHAQVRLADGYTPTETNLLISTEAPLHFGADVLEPVNHRLTVQWFTNGAPVPGATAGSLVLAPSLLREGGNSVSVIAFDGTVWVRDDPAGRLRETNTWTVTVSLPRLRLESPLWLQGNRFAFRISGTAPNGVVVLTSTNLTEWAAVSTNSLAGGELWHTNGPLPLVPPRFYRAWAR